MAPCLTLKTNKKSPAVFHSELQDSISDLCWTFLFFSFFFKWIRTKTPLFLFFIYSCPSLCVCLFVWFFRCHFFYYTYIYMRMYLYTSWALNFFLNQVFCCWFTLLLPKRRAIVFCFFVVFFSLPHFFILYLNVDFFGEKESVWLFSQCIFVQIYI